MANIDKLIINDPSASEPTNPLEMYVAKINGTYTGDIPEPTNDLEKALAQVAESGGSAAEWPKLMIKVYNDSETKIINPRLDYIDENGSVQIDVPVDIQEGLEIPFPHYIMGDTVLLSGWLTVRYDSITGTPGVAISPEQEDADIVKLDTDNMIPNCLVCYIVNVLPGSLIMFGVV